MYIANIDTAGVIVPPAISVAPGVSPDDVAHALGLAPGNWREITGEEAKALQAPTLEDLRNAFTAAIQKRLDDFAGTRNYDSIHTATTYDGDPDPVFAVEGRYAKEVRGATWRKGYEILNGVLAGQRPMPGIDEVMVELPPLKWPDEEPVI